jgi:hypothetical protein
MIVTSPEFNYNFHAAALHLLVATAESLTIIVVNALYKTDHNPLPQEPAFRVADESWSWSAPVYTAAFFGDLSAD